MKRFNSLTFLLTLSLVGLAGCSTADKYKSLETIFKYESVEMFESSSKQGNTVTKVIVTLKNTGKKPIYLDGKFYFYIVKKTDQTKMFVEKNGVKYTDPKYFLSKVPASEISLLSFNSWKSVSGIFTAIQPYTEVTLTLAIDQPTDTYLERFELVNQNGSNEELVNVTYLGFCPFKGGSESHPSGQADWNRGMVCQKGKFI